ncbi:hypothetical protein D3C72_1416260 [compost metagenome]
MARAAAGSGLIGRNGCTLDQVVGEQAAQRHQHQADGAVAADEGLDAFVQALLNHVAVDRVQNDNRVILHAQ